MSFVVGDADNGFHIKARLSRLFLGETGAPRIQSRGKLYDARTQTSGVRAVFAGKRFGKTSGGNICGRAHGRPLTIVCKTVLNYRAVACRVNVVKIGFLITIYANCSLDHLNSAVFKKIRGWTNTYTHYYNIRVKLAYGSNHRFHRVFSPYGAK